MQQIMMIQQTSSIICLARGKGPVRKKIVSDHIIRERIWIVYLCQRARHELRLHMRSQFQSFTFLLFRDGLCKRENIQCFLSVSCSRRGQTAAELCTGSRDLTVTGRALPGRQTRSGAEFHPDLQGARRGQGTRGELARLGSTKSSPTWLKTAATDSKSRGCQILQKQEQFYAFQRTPQAGQNSGLK